MHQISGGVGLGALPKREKGSGPSSTVHLKGRLKYSTEKYNMFVLSS